MFILVAGFVLQHFGHALLIKKRDGDRKLAFGSRDMQVLRKWWDAMYLAQYVAVILNFNLRSYLLMCLQLLCV